MAADNVLTVAVNVFTSPGEAYVAIKEKPRVWFPLLIVVLATAAVSAIYTLGVDIVWLQEQQLQQRGLTDAEIEQAQQALEFTAGLPRPALAVVGALPVVIIVTLIYLLYALYLKITSAFTKDGIRYVQWLGLIGWSALPSLLSALGQIVNLLTSDITLMPQAEINPLSFRNLLGLDAGGGSAATLGAYLDPTVLWTAILTVLGYRAWTGKGWLLSVAVALGPGLLIMSAVLAA